MTNPDHLDTEHSGQLTAILNRSPELATLADHMRQFAHMICHQAGAHLAEWITSAKATTISELAPSSPAWNATSTQSTPD